MKIVWNPVVAQWVGLGLFDDPGAFSACQAMGVADRTGLIGGVVFHDWQPRAGLIEASAFSTNSRWLTREAIRQAMRYVFDDVGCQMVYARQEVGNDPARKIWLALGGKEYVIERLFGRDKDGSVICVTEEAWRASRFNGKAKA